MKTIKIPTELQKMNNFFKNKGFEAFLVGGAVRDMIRGKEASDWDIATNASPKEVTSIFNKVIPTGIEHGTVTVIFMGHHIEVTTYRTETDYSDGRHPDKVTYAATIEKDLSRRDFTMNALAANLDTGMIVDPFNGQKDIKKKIIRTVGNPLERFSEDGLRPIRAIRFASQLGYAIEKNTLDAISQTIEITKKISIERFRDEFLKIISSDNSLLGLQLLEQTGELAFFIPELTACRNVVQADNRGFHKFDVLDHLFYSCNGARKNSIEPFIVPLAALFHDIGKPSVRKVETDGLGNTIYTFFNHEKASSKIASQVFDRLKLPKATNKYVCHLIEQHMFHYESNWTDAAIRRFLVRITPSPGLLPLEVENPLNQTIKDLFDLRIADVTGMTGMPSLLSKGPWSQNLLEFKDRIDTILAQENALGLKNLDITGKDLIANGIPSGKAIGNILQELLETVLEDPRTNKKEQLLQIALHIWESKQF